MRPSAPSFLRVLVPVKRTIDYAVKIRVNKELTGVETEGVKHSINPFDEIAVEESLRLRERHPKLITNITALTIGPAKATDVLRHSLALGVDSAIHVVTPTANVSPLIVSRVLSSLLSNPSLAKEEEKWDLVILGKQAIDDDSGAVGGLLGGKLDWPIANFISSIKLSEDGKEAECSREIDGGLERMKFNLPGIVSTDLRLNEPRFAKLQNIMAKKKPVLSLDISELGIETESRLKMTKVAPPPERKGGEKVEDVDAVIAALKEKGILAQ
ncbi:electron transfer flavoprotein, beta subunit [Atractiella rhizophila]|nr:electron transfer flavoprotein, beta subunit [Atractiella rhizophila]